MSPDENESLEEMQVEELQGGALDAARHQIQSTGVAAGSWEVAGNIVRNFRPVPWILWKVVRSVFGKSSQIGKPDSIVFDIVHPLVVQAARDKSLGGAEDAMSLSLEKAVQLTGTDTAAALCLMHGVCRRISSTLSERIWRPILDDALLRAQIGMFVGGNLERFGRGRGMLAGFSGRSGLAIQIASGDMNKAQRTLEGLAAGMAMRDVGMTIYGCDPLQVSAMTLAAAGVSSDAAIGTASYSTEGKNIPPSSTQFLWLSAFAIAERLRMGDVDRVENRYWDAFDLNQARRGELKQKVQQLQRKGHHWGWVINPL